MSEGRDMPEWLPPLLVCPKTRMPLRRVGDELVSDAAGLAYPVRDGVPVLLVEEARRLEESAG
jgi:uncharacterized protein YbaR (Trm112 family)